MTPPPQRNPAPTCRPRVLEAGFRHIAAQNIRTPEQHMADIVAGHSPRSPRRSGALSSGLWLGIVRVVARARGLRPLATVRIMAEKHDREKLIDVALDLCIRQGYEATTIDQIAAAVGVTSPAVGRYFATKDAIILSIVDDELAAEAACQH